MATGGQKGIGHNLVNVGTLTLEPDNLDPWGVVVVRDKLVITDWESDKIRVYRRHDGMWMSSSDRLESEPRAVCCVNDTDLCVVMIDGIITLMSVLDSGLISRGTTFDLTPSFDSCDGVAAFRDKVVVSGVKDDTICWCVVSVQDGRHDNLHKVCRRGWSWMTTNENMVYISCNTNFPDDRGVYGFNLLTPSQLPYTYNPKGVSLPWGITVDDNGYLFVCDDSKSIHHLTEKCELVAIYTEGIPRDPVAILWDRGILYLTASGSNVITMYETPHQGIGIPVEILNMDDRSIQLFENALKDGKEKVYSIRVLVVGHLGVGKTTLIKRLLGKDVNISERHSTEGIDVHLHCCDVSLSSNEWTLRKNDSEQDYRLQRLVKVLNEIQSVRNEAADENKVVIPHEGEITDISTRDHVAEEAPHHSPEHDLVQNLSSTTSQQVGFHSVVQRNLTESDENTMVRPEPGENVSSESHVKDPNREILQLLQKNADKIKHNLGKYVPLTMWDFAGQYSFYTTHQMFLSRRAIYLLVSDISRQVDDLVQDECYFDRRGIIKCKVHELVEVWLNSIHSCAPPDKESMDSHTPSDNIIPPPVILVGTHVDAIPQAGMQGQTKIQPEVSTEKGSVDKSFQQGEPRPVKPVGYIFTKKGAAARKVKGQMQVVAKKELDEPQTKAVTQGQAKYVSTLASKPVLSKMQPKVSTNKESLEKPSQQSKPKLVKPMASTFTKKGAEASKVKGQMQVVAKRELDEPQTKAVKQGQIKQVSTLASKPVLSKMQPKVSTNKGSLEKPSHQRKPKLVKSVASTFSKKGAESSTVKVHMQVVVKKGLDEPQTEDYRHEICENYFREIRSHLKDKPSRFHLVEEDFAIDNSVVDSKLDGLKKKIVEVASRQPYWGEEIPARWLPLEQALMNFRAQGLKVIPWSLLENISQAGGVQISTDELDLFLRFQHEIGTILYFSTELLKEKIVLEPQWMINALKSLITAEMFVLRNNPSLIAMWFEFKDGKLSPELIDALWTKDNNADLHDNKEHILLLMEQLNIIAKPKLYIDDASEVKEVNYFFAPCMLYAEPPREVICPEPHPQMESSSVMCYVFTGKFLPAPIFHRLLAACVAHWPLATKKTEMTLENQIFCGCGVFQLDQYHKLTLHFWDYVISMRVTRKGITDKTPSSNMCIEVKEFVAKVLNKIIGYLGHSLKFEEFIQCPEYNGESVNSLIPVSLLKENTEVCCDFHDNIIEANKFLKFWFEGQVKDQESQCQDDADEPITQEHINHARLCNALTTVCANALRKILLNNVPSPHTDIYKAILANKTKLKKLNPDQNQLVFPDPQGLSTGKVQEFDISLLYTIVRNVSSVPAPSNGWGKPPADKPRDTTLGASVERIRLYRNYISGHSVDGKISQQAFKDYWAKIEDVLNEIEIAIGNHDYLKDLEKRKNQPITPHEARELRKTFQEYKKQTEAAADDIQLELDNVKSALEKVQSKVKILKK